MARSLMDGIDLDKKATPKKAARSASQTKTYIAVGLLVVAVGILVVYFVVLPNRTPTAGPVDPVQQQQAVQQAQQNVEQAKQRGAEVGGGY